MFLAAFHVTLSVLPLPLPSSFPLPSFVIQTQLFLPAPKFVDSVILQIHCELYLQAEITKGWMKVFSGSGQHPGSVTTLYIYLLPNTC